MPDRGGRRPVVIAMGDARPRVAVSEQLQRTVTHPAIATVADRYIGGVRSAATTARWKASFMT
ncbi:hypothetical protein [Actinoplanes sp. NPDC020271]|uniref:hypothetical protein n=1 Tax=Actinoplanes sp. NPDC020271 TaxID=3363896 RepID=UPI0037A72EA5